MQPDTDVPASQGVQGLNRYAYVNNNPIRYNDPTGHFAIPAIVIAVAAVVLKVIDYGWTGYDIVQAGRVYFDEGSTEQAKQDAKKAIGAAIAFELLEPDELTPGLPIDDIVRHGDDIGDFIYRKASGSADSLTPRPGVDDLDLKKGGLSFFDSIENMVNNMPFKPGDKYVVVDPKKLDGLDVILDNIPPGHVSVRPPTLSALKDWASAWKTETVHKFTQIIQNAIVGKPVKWK